MTLTNPWPGRGWPLSLAEERAFIEVASHHTSKPSPSDEDEVVKGVTRGNITLLATALRHGADLETMLQITPGIDVRALARAHHHVEKLIRQAVGAWTKLAGDLGPRSIDKHSENAAKLLPLSVARIRIAIESGRDAAVVLAAEQTRIETVRRHCDQLTEQLVVAPDTTTVAALARQLYHPDEECLLQHPRFLPNRVSELSPLRLARLLGEQSVGFDHPAAPEPPKHDPSIAAARARPGRGRR